jgi:bifunctional non-homologous end joining protein LigD/DNA ligase-1
MSSITKAEKAKYYADFPEKDDAVWIMPQLVCTVEYMERTPHGGLRQPVFKGLRDDKVPLNCVVRR